MLAHLRMEAYPAYQQTIYPGGLVKGAPPTLEGNDLAIQRGKQKLSNGERGA